MAKEIKHPLNGKTAVVTGAGSGIGQALARHLAAAGSPVAIADWNEEGLQETADSISGPVLMRKLDVRDRQGLLAFAASVQEWTPAPLGLVVNNAGVTVAQSVAGASVEDDQWVMDVNLGGVVNGIRAFLPIMLRQGEGTLASVSSVFGLVGFPGQSAYCASKFGVRGFMESLRHEVKGTGVRVAVIHPGGINTNIVRNARFHAEAAGGGDHTDFINEFAQIARTSPEKAAATIVRGVEAGHARIRIGPDAYMLDWLSRYVPVRYYDVLERLDGLTPRKGLSLKDRRAQTQQSWPK